MMETVFFPFSHLGRQQCRTLQAFFPRFKYLSLAGAGDAGRDPRVSEMETKGVVAPLFTTDKDLAAIEARVRSYLEWVKLHRGNERNLKALLKDNPYFTDDTALTGIKSQLHQRLSGGRTAPETETNRSEAATANPLLFLKFAQMADAENEKIDAELQELEKSKAALFSALKGETEMDLPDIPAVAPSDPGQSMTGARIRNWLGYAEEKGLFQKPGEKLLLVTTSEAVFDRLEPIFGEGINALDIDSIKVHEDGCDQKPQWQKQLSETLGSILETPAKWEKELPGAKDGCELTGRIRLTVFPEAKGETEDKPDGIRMAACLVSLEA